MKIEDLKLDENGNITRLLYKPGWYISFVRSVSEPSYIIKIYNRDYPDASKFKNREDYKDINKLANISVIHQRAEILEDTFEKMEEKDFWKYLFYQIKLIEMHEVKEWFKVDGFYLENPHSETESPFSSISDSECFFNDGKV